MFIQTEETPNPNALKFFPGREVNHYGPRYYKSSEECDDSKLARNLINLQHVTSVFFGTDFITLTKNENIEWAIIKPEIMMVIMDHFVAGLPVFDQETQKINRDDLPEIERQIIELIETRVKPSVAMDGGNIEYKGFEDGVVLLELHGACAGCPSSSITLKQGIEGLLKHYVPEVIAVKAVDA